MTREKGPMEKRLETDVRATLIRHHRDLNGRDVAYLSVMTHQARCLSIIADAITELLKDSKEEPCDI